MNCETNNGTVDVFSGELASKGVRFNQNKIENSRVLNLISN